MTTDGPAVRLGVAVAIAAATWAVVDGIGTAVAHRSHASDYLQDYLSARALDAGGSVYVLAADIPTTPADRAPPSIRERNDHPPTYVLFLYPLSPLPYDAAFVALGVLNLAAAAATGVVIGRALGWPPAACAGLTAGVLVHAGTNACVGYGNVSLVLGLLIAGGWAAVRRGAWWGGGLLAVAAAVKVFPGLLAVALVAGRRWRAAAWFVATSLGVVGVTAAVVGVDDFVTFSERAAENTRLHVGQDLNVSRPGAVHRLIGEPGADQPITFERLAVRPRLAWALATAAQAVVGAVAVWACFPRGRPSADVDRAFAVLIPAMLLMSPITWIHALPLLALPAAVIGDRLWADRQTGRLAALGVCVALTSVNDIWLARLLYAAAGGPGPSYAVLLLLAPTVGTLGVFALAVLERPRGQRQGA